MIVIDPKVDVLSRPVTRECTATNDFGVWLDILERAQSIPDEVVSLIAEYVMFAHYTDRFAPCLT